MNARTDVEAEGRVLQGKPGPRPPPEQAGLEGQKKGREVAKFTISFCVDILLLRGDFWRHLHEKTDSTPSDMFVRCFFLIFPAISDNLRKKFQRHEIMFFSEADDSLANGDTAEPQVKH